MTTYPNYFKSLTILKPTFLLPCAILLSLLFYSSTIVSKPNTAKPDISEYGYLYFNEVDILKVVPGGIVTTLIQDDTGFMWIGTQQGLYRYDGIEFKRYWHQSDKENTISSNYITSLWQAPSGHIWIGTYSSGIDRFDPHTGEFVNINEGNNEDGLTNSRVWRISGNQSEHVFVPTNNGFNIIKQSDLSVIHLEKVAGQKI